MSEENTQPQAPETQPEAQAAAPEQAPQQQQGQRRGGGGGRGDGRGQRRGPRPERRNEEDEGGVKSSTVGVFRSAKVVKGGKNFAFEALVAAGDGQGNIGLGYGKAKEVPAAVEKATKDARRRMVKVSLNGGTIPHEVMGQFGASSIKLVPARPGTGIKAGRHVRPVLELVGLRDVLTKAYGSTNKKNLCKAAIKALASLRTKEEVASQRGVQL